MGMGICFFSFWKLSVFCLVFSSEDVKVGSLL